MGRVPPKEYTNEPRGGFEQVMEKLPSKQQPDTIAISNSDPNDNIELAVNPSMEELQYMMAARNAKSYFVFGSVLTLLGLAFSLVSMLSCNFATVNWAVDGSPEAFQATITHIGLFRWYNPNTSSCWAYAANDDEFFFKDGIARGLSAAAVVFGGCAAFTVLVIMIANVACCAKRGCCSAFNLNSTSHSTTFFTLSGLTFLSSILQICTLTYFKQGNDNDYAITCNATQDSNCTMGVGAHYAIISFVVYLLGCLVYAMAGVGCRVAEGLNSGENLPPPPPPPFPPTQQQKKKEEDLGPADDESGPPPPAPSAQFAAFGEQDELQSV